MQHVKMAIASFERTIVAGDSPFDRWYYRRREDRDERVGDPRLRGVPR